MVMAAVEGDPCTTVRVAAVIPSTVMVTVPEGAVAPGFVEVMYAVASMEPPAVGVRVDGSSTIEDGLLDTLMVTAGEIVLP